MPAPPEEVDWGVRAPASRPHGRSPVGRSDRAAKVESSAERSPMDDLTSGVKEAGHQRRGQHDEGPRSQPQHGSMRPARSAVAKANASRPFVNASASNAHMARLARRPHARCRPTAHARARAHRLSLRSAELECQRPVG